ncbi:MAG: YdcF family protein [Anaerolineales bacterium]
MDAIFEIFKAYLIPGSFEFLLIGFFLGVVLLFAHRETRFWGSSLLAFLAVLYFLLSLPLTARTFERILSDRSEPIRSVEAAEGAEAIVVLGGGSATFRAGGNEINELSDATALRVLEGARLYELLDHPAVVVSGGTDELTDVLTPESVPMQQELLDLGVEPEHIHMESISGDTREQAVQIGKLLQANDFRDFILVTSPIHMRRSLATLRAQGLDPVPSPSNQHSDGHVVERGGILPHPSALRASHAAIREGMAVLFYWLNGWTGPPWGP